MDSVNSVNSVDPVNSVNPIDGNGDESHASREKDGTDIYKVPNSDNVLVVNATAVEDTDMMDDDGSNTDFTVYSGRTVDMDVSCNGGDSDIYTDAPVDCIHITHCQRYMYDVKQATLMTRTMMNLRRQQAQNSVAQTCHNRRDGRPHGNNTGASDDDIDNKTRVRSRDSHDTSDDGISTGFRSRMMEEHEVFAKDVDRVKDGHAITVHEYLTWKNAHDVRTLLKDDVFRYSYVRCDEHDARRIMRLSSPLLPIVTYKQARDPWTPTIRQYIAYLGHKLSVEVHDYHATPDCDDTILKLPDWWTPSEVKDAMNECPPRVINCLNLAGFKENSLPPCFQGLPDFNILEKIRESDTSGKSVERVPNDLSGMVEFTLLATTHATSLAHQDSQGTITTLEVLEGEKLWLIWPYLDRKAKIEWQTDAQDRYSPEASPLALYLRPGDTLIMPAGTVHAVYTMSTCLAAGRRLWDSRRMVEVAEAMALERTCPDLTNESEAGESRQKLRNIERVWGDDDGNGYWSFGDDKDLVTFRTCLDELFPAKSARSKGKNTVQAAKRT